MKDLIYGSFLTLSIILTISNIGTAFYKDAVTALEKVAALRAAGNFEVAGNGVKTHQTRFYSGEYITVSLSSGTVPANLEIYVYDPHGREVTVDDYSWDGKRIAFYAPKSGDYTIKIENQNTFKNKYNLDIKWS